MKTQNALIVALLAVALGVAITTRWEVSAVQGNIVRLDRWTGAVTQCQIKVVTTQCE